jgi:phenylacetate-CoA ligase
MRGIHRHLLFPAFESLFKRRATLSHLAALERSQWLDAAALKASQLESLRRLLRHAQRSCEYYRTSWNVLGLDPNSLASLSDFCRWPVIDRDMIRANRVAMRSGDFTGKLITKATGGSSGVPLQFDVNTESHERRTAASLRGYAWAGAGVGTKQLYLWGVPLGERSAVTRFKDRAYHAIHRRRIVSCFGAGEELTRRFLDELARYRPDAIVAYVNPLYDVARRIEERGLRVPFTPSSIVVGAEKLHAFQRDSIERVFGAPVFETYGSREFMLIGAECERHQGLHLTSEHLLVEILNDDGSPTPTGEEGNVVITDLYNLGMPFIRYATGDRAIACSSSCPCGRGLPLLKEVRGRRLDMLVVSGGRRMPGEFFPHLVKDFPAVRRFQVIQESAALVRFRLAAEGMLDADRHRLEAAVRAALGPEVQVDFEPVEEIPLTPAGKLQVVINRLAASPIGPSGDMPPSLSEAA